MATIKNTENWSFETKQLHIGQETADPVTDSRAVPIYQTTSYVFHDSQHAADRFGLADAGNIYGRLTNSTQGVFEDRIAALEGGVAGLAVASGAAAVTYALQNVLQNGDHIVAADNLYGGSYNLITHTLTTQGVEYTIVDFSDLAAVEQICIWGERVGVPVIKQQMGSDPASVAFDTISSAKANGADVVLIDTAGRLHNKVGLMNELKKIKDVMKKVVPTAPDEVMLVLDGSTGQNAFEQAKQFAAVTPITSLAITKLDGTAKGGVVIGISDQLKVPVKYIGLGESMEALQLFNKKQFVNSLFENK